jgi:hypothetical protein
MIELPGTFVEMPLNEVGKCAKFYYDRQRSLCVILLDAKKKTWTIAHGNPYNNEHIEGCTNGYNGTARSVCYALWKLGLWTKKESEDFNEQQWQADKAARDQSEIKEARDLLMRAGFEVTYPITYG